MKDHRVLIVEPNRQFREHLRISIQSLGIAELFSVTNFADAFKRISERAFSFCIIGYGLDKEAQIRFLETAKKEAVSSHCALIPVTEEKEKDQILAFVAAGADTVLLSPFTSTSLGNVLVAARKALQEKINAKAKVQEEITSLSWIIQKTAGRLSTLVSAIETYEKKQNTKIEGNPRTLKEALLSVFTAANFSDEKYLSSIVELLSNRK